VQVRGAYAPSTWRQEQSGSLATLNGGVATLTTSKLAVGTHSITAEYLGDADCAESTSPVLDQVVQ